MIRPTWKDALAAVVAAANQVNLGRVPGVVSVVDLARLRRLRVAAAAVTLLFTLGAFDQLKTPALPTPARAAASVEEIADRLRGRLDDDVTYAHYVALPDTPFLAWCWPKNMEARMPPDGVPAYSGELLSPEIVEPLKVRFWITSPEAAVRAVAAARRGTEECGHSSSDEFVLKDVAGFDQWGWRGMQALITTDAWTEEGDSGAQATIVAARGGLLAEVTWAWPFEAGGEPARHVLLQGAMSATSVLAAIGGDPALPAPAAAMAPSASAAMAAALPPPSAYGKDMMSWPAPWDDPRSHELVCGDSFFEQNAYDGAPAVTRRLIGEVSVREDVLFLPDEHVAEQARTRPLNWGGSCLSDEGKQPYSINPRLEAFTRGPWTGEIKTFAVRRPDPPHRPKDNFRRSVAHVAMGVRRGTTMVYLRWQGPAGTDPAAALRAGRAALIRTLDRLPSGG
ncbi:hypothetical protein [Nonomuraea sp. NEAU-A123]|uniref:hypothetical protein n=1 Tax=Nonomuraea sp. NEAU-A123 TaxID=2839649 RepID=UPI001BE41013|nr:hypothetical protein [Nonomuraea sp. NEAU-A123]MBT2233726.1 hypothetical protein [Nonomuraea sp. NEAU-A123]